MTADLTVIVGPSGVGKGTVVTELVAAHPEVWLSVSATTRPPRPGESERGAYLFVSDAEFDELIRTNGLLEWATVHGTARYGTPAAPVAAALAAGRPVILEIDLQGARQVRRRMPDARFVFLAPPSWDELARRLASRGTEASEAIERRLRTAEEELAAQAEFDHVLTNHDVATTVAELVALLGLGDQ